MSLNNLETLLVTGPDAIGITTVALNRPQRLKTFTPTMSKELRLAFRTLSSCTKTRVIILTAIGRHFCAGADLSGNWDPKDFPKDHDTLEGSVSLSIHHCKKPVIIVIHGAAIGVGATLALPCTLRIATRDAKIAMPFAKRGLVVDAAASFFLPRIVGAGRAMWWLLMGETVRAADSQCDGLWNFLVDSQEEGVHLAENLAAQLAEMNPTSLEATRKLVWEVESSEEAHLKETAVMKMMRERGETAEGARAFVEKRKPNWPMCTGDDVEKIVRRLEKL